MRRIAAIIAAIGIALLILGACAKKTTYGTIIPSPPVGGDLSGNAGSATVIAEQGQSISSVTPSEGAMRYYSGSSWVLLDAGTNGQLLQTQGAGSPPLWTSDTNSGTAFLTVPTSLTGFSWLDQCTSCTVSASTAGLFFTTPGVTNGNPVISGYYQASTGSATQSCEVGVRYYTVGAASTTEIYAGAGVFLAATGGSADAGATFDYVFLELLTQYYFVSSVTTNASPVTLLQFSSGTVWPGTYSANNLQYMPSAATGNLVFLKLSLSGTGGDTLNVQISYDRVNYIPVFTASATHIYFGGSTGAPNLPVRCGALVGFPASTSYTNYITLNHYLNQ
jgi:hypothetical protein